MTKKNKCDTKKCASPKKTRSNGKGDSARNNISKNFRSNYDSINWKTKKK